MPWNIQTGNLAGRKMNLELSREVFIMKKTVSFL